MGIAVFAVVGYLASLVSIAAHLRDVDPLLVWVNIGFGVFFLTTVAVVVITSFCRER